MFRKMFLVKGACVLCALVAVMILVGGCGGGSTPTPTAMPPCDPPPPPIGVHQIIDWGSGYIRSHYPEQNLPATGWVTKQSGYSSQATEISGDWTRSADCGIGACGVIITNQATGFRWEGNANWTGGTMDYRTCSYTPAVIDRWEERSVTIPTPSKSATSIIPSPTTKAFPTYGLSTDVTPAPTPTH